MKDTGTGADASAPFYKVLLTSQRKKGQGTKQA
jgi:hypothetical protein